MNKTTFKSWSDIETEQQIRKGCGYLDFKDHFPPSSEFVSAEESQSDIDRGA